ncbi:MAG: UDP-N-acetylglucosamine 1-carboxyvinyltransferase [Oscillospiraceae bacterium]|nr:UDP-N-acetylglucosamine 1-carboxyvinyltransferase [Oscillospiraceae bacterium]
MAEEILRIRGGLPLRGEVTVQGAKNSALPLMAAALLCSGETCFTNVPQLTDVYAASRILNRLGCRCHITGNTVRIVNSGEGGCEIPDADMRAMRSSIMFLGPVLGSRKECILTMPGGCELGPRPIDLHLDAMRQMGVRIRSLDGVMHCKAGKLCGAHIHLPIPSVGVTENIIMAAVAAEGETVITNAACEPEITDLAGYLNACGAAICGAGEQTVVIQGGKKLTGTEYRVMPDRIAAMTYLCAGAAAGGAVCLRDAEPKHLESCLAVLEQAGCTVGICGNRIFLDRSGTLRSIRYIKTMPYPGFPTDVQALISAVLCTARGTSLLEETIFENRFKHMSELMRMGADIRVSGRIAAISGVKSLNGADVSAADLRGGAALAVAAAAAEGETVIHGLHHLDRGYENFAETFHNLGIRAERVSFFASEHEKSRLKPKKC